MCTAVMPPIPVQREEVKVENTDNSPKNASDAFTRSNYQSSSLCQAPYTILLQGKANSGNRPLRLCRLLSGLRLRQAFARETDYQSQSPLLSFVRIL